MQAALRTIAPQYIPHKNITEESTNNSVTKPIDYTKCAHLEKGRLHLYCNTYRGYCPWREINPLYIPPYNCPYYKKITTITK